MARRSPPWKATTSRRGRRTAARNSRRLSEPSVNFRLSLCLFALAFSGCSKITMLRTEELRKVQGEVKAVKAQVERVQKSVDELNLAQGGSTSKMKADLTLMMKELESQITRLHSEIDETQYRLTQL